MIPTLTTKIDVELKFKDAFADWQAELNTAIALFPGFVSLEIVSPADTKWMITQQFNSKEHLLTWRKSKERKALLDRLKSIIGKNSINESESTHNALSGVTEVFITEVDQKNDASYREWIAKIHQVEAKFPGFQGVYVQSPGSIHAKNWITLLQFDTPENLNLWLESPEREEVLNKGKPLISSLENHRVISSYASWFSSIAKAGELPPVWKQTMLVLLVLFPIVMLELKFLSPLTAGLNSSAATFIGNALSVTLISWPMMPIAIKFLGWWLSPETNKLSKTIAGTLLIVGLYLLEIMIFWHLNHY